MNKYIYVILLTIWAVGTSAQKKFSEGEFYINMESESILIVGTTSETSIFGGHVDVKWGIASIAHDLANDNRDTDINIYKAEDIVDGFPLRDAEEIDDPDFVCCSPYKRIEAEGKKNVKKFFKALSKCINGAALELKMRDIKTGDSFSYYWLLTNEKVKELVDSYNTMK